MDVILRRAECLQSSVTDFLKCQLIGTLQKRLEHFCVAEWLSLKASAMSVQLSRLSTPGIFYLLFFAKGFPKEDPEPFPYAILAHN